MQKAKRLPVRNDVKTEDTWDLRPLYRTDAAWRKGYRDLESMVAGYDRFRGKLGTSAGMVRACFDFDCEVEQLAERLGSYAFLRQAEDVANSTYQGMAQQFTFLATRLGEASSFIAPELQSLPKKTLEGYLRSRTLKDFRVRLERLMRSRAHILSAKEERLLALQGEVAGSARKIFGQLTDADFDFGTVRDEAGAQVELSQGSFRVFLESSKRRVRRAAFDRFYDIHERHANTLAAALGSSVLQDVYHARVRNHPSALEAALFGDNVPVAVYTNLIAAVRDGLPALYRYLDLRRRVLKLDAVHSYDTYCPIGDAARTRIRYDEAVEHVHEAVRPLGAEYCRVIRKGLSARWVDRYENQGKRSGAFSAGAYVGPPYILMNYKDTLLDSVFTLAHEGGHSMHTYFSAKHQPFQTYEYTIFVAEVASTVNEQFLSHYFMARARSKKRRAQLICKEIDEIRGALIRQTMFAEYEKVIHELAEAGEPLTLQRLRSEYRKLLTDYFGPDFAIDDVLELEGLRIPHFYRAFYVYKYATGISAAIALSQQILNGGASERDRYLDFLKAGGSKYPLDLLRDAGVDLESPEPVAAAMTRFAELVAELEDLLT